MHYRLFEPGDFDDLYAIEEICFQPPQRFSRRYMRELTTSPQAATWIAEAEGILAPARPSAVTSTTGLPDSQSFGCIAGFAIVEWTQQLSGIVAYITTIEVLPEFRSLGIGAELMRRLEGSANAEQAAAIWLHVDVENASAIRLYERLGYQKTGRADHFYARNRPAAIYVKSLP